MDRSRHPIGEFPRADLDRGTARGLWSHRRPTLSRAGERPLPARSLRHDLFIRGAQRLGGTDRNPALHEVVLLATVAEDEFKYQIEMAEGKAALQREFYGAVMAALAAGPRSVGELLALPETASSTPPVVAMIRLAANAS